MQRLKDEGIDPSQPNFSMSSNPSAPANVVNTKPPGQICMTNSSITRRISQSELESDQAKTEAWFVVHGEVKPFVSPCSQHFLQ